MAPPRLAVVTRKSGWLDDPYIDWLNRAGFTDRVVFGPDQPFPAATDLAPFAGLILTGGSDFAIESGAYADRDEALAAHIYGPNPIRDRLECHLLDWAYAHGRPVLGVCRGLQSMNVHGGGTLIPDIERRLGAVRDEAHTQKPEELESDTEPDRWHEARLEPDSFLARYIPTGSVRVNSFHHQAIDRLAANLRLTATASDGIIEAVEHRTLSRVWAVQFHPERMLDDTWVIPWTRSWLEL